MFLLLMILFKAVLLLPYIYALNDDDSFSSFSFYVAHLKGNVMVMIYFVSYFLSLDEIQLQVRLNHLLRLRWASTSFYFFPKRFFYHQAEYLRCSHLNCQF